MPHLCKSILLFLYDCNILSLSLRKECRLRVIDPEAILGPKGDVRRLRNEEHHSPDIVRLIKSRRLRWTVILRTLEAILGPKGDVRRLRNEEHHSPDIVRAIKNNN